MVRPQRLGRIAFIAPPPLGLDDLLLEIIAAGIDGNGAEVGEPKDEEEGVEDDRFVARGWSGIERRVVEDELGAVGEKSDEDADGGHGEVLHDRGVVEAGHYGEGRICTPLKSDVCGNRS